jgi:hypothetical protein
MPVGPLFCVINDRGCGRARAVARGRAPSVIQRQLGHGNLGGTSIYLQGIDPEGIIETVHARRPPMIPATMELALPRGR